MSKIEKLCIHFEYSEYSPSKLIRKCDVYSGKGYNMLIYKAGDFAGSLHSSGYYNVSFESKTYRVHRVIWEIIYGRIPPNKQIDHIDGNCSNNTITNLRLVDKENMRNKKLYKNNSYGVSGITLIFAKGYYYWCTRWCDHITNKRKSKQFSINLLGIMVAYRDAVIFRNNIIANMNKEGAGYTKRHGTIC